MKKCPRCLCPVEDGAAYCGVCGLPFDDVDVIETDESAVPPTEGSEVSGHIDLEKVVEPTQVIEALDEFDPAHTRSFDAEEVKEKAANETELDKATLSDIVTELMKPGRDIRDGLPAPMLRKDIMGIEDLKVGMELTGTVRNVVDFGAFIDIGVHQDGLVHISEITDKYIRHPLEALKVGQVVQVYVKDVDVKKNRIALTMKKKKQ